MMSYKSIADHENTSTAKEDQGGRKPVRAGRLVLLLLASVGVFTVAKSLTNAFTSTTSMAALGNTTDGCVLLFARAAPARAGSRPSPRPL